MGRGRRWGEALAGLLVLGSLIGVLGHVQLAFPPPTLKLDFLDNARTSGICGYAASGSDNSGFWKLPEPDVDTVTDLVAGSTVSVEWDLHYAHQGGFRFELYDSDLNMVSKWDDNKHWGCSHDGTQQSIKLELPKKECEGCILRLQRQALEWGATYLFHSCALVNIVKDTNVDAACSGCSGHGTCNEGKCVCDSSKKKGFWYGQYCERQNECEEDSHCGEQGECIDTKALTAPTKQCYCKKGFFGKEVVRGSNVADLISTRDCSEKTKLTLGDPEDWETEYPNKLKAGDTMTVYYKIDEEKKEIEYAVTAKTTNWVSWGLRADSVKGAEPAKAEKKEGKEEAEPGAEPTAEPTAAGSEPTGRRKLLNRMPVLDMEAFDSQRTLLQENGKKNDKGETPKTEEKDGAEPGAEPEPGVESEGSSEAEGANAVGCPVGGDPSTVELDEGTHYKKPLVVEVTLGGDGKEYKDGGDGKGEGEAEAEPKTDGNKGRRLSRMPALDDEVNDRQAVVGRKVLDHHEEGSEGDAGAEAEAGSEAEGGAPTKITKTYFAEGTACENLIVDNPAAHPMINQDLIVAYARGDRIRVQDTFTPSRARPSPDVFFGGKDDILDAVGEETEDGFTNIKLRRKLETDDQAGDYCMVKDVNYLVIYAIGQGPDPSHSPNSSLETGRASNKEFYGEDELKYHGGGIGVNFPGRGSFGVVDFFEEAAAEGTCIPSSLEDFDCMSDELGGSFQLHWKTEADGVKFGAQAQGTGWISIAFPETPGAMVGADAVLGWVDGDETTIDVFKLEGKDSSAITAGNDAFAITDASVENEDGGALLKFTRAFDDSFTSDEPVDVLVGFHASSGPGFAYHGTDRGPSTVDLAAAPSANAAASKTCDESAMDGFDCASKQLDDKMTVNWKVEEAGVKVALEAEGTGYVAIAWPETPGQMTDATAVIAWVDDDGPQIGVFDMESRAVEGIVPSNKFEILDPEIVQEDGKTILTFTRVYDDANRRRNLLFTSESGPTDLLFAYHESSRSLAFHTDRDGQPIDFQSEPDAGTLAVEDRSIEEQSELSVTGGDVSGCTPSNLVDFECMQLAGDFSLHWTATPAQIVVGAQATAEGYVAIGFSSTPGEMIGSKSVIGWAGAEDFVDLYTLDTKQVSGIIVEANAIPVMEDPTVEEIDGTTLVTFTRVFDDDFAYDATHDLVYAHHTADEIAYHGPSTRGSLQINFGTGASVASSGEDLKPYWDAHAWLMVISWGGLLPIGIIIARTLKDKGPTWFYLHLVFQVGGFGLAIIGWIIALTKFEPEDGFRHGRVGMAVMILGFTQASAFLRPHPGAKFRHEWEWLHWSVGRVALILGIYNIFTGLDRYDELNMVGNKFHVNYGMWLMSLFVVYLNLEARAQRIKGEKMQSELNVRLKGGDAGSSPTSHPPMGAHPQVQPDLHHRAGVMDV